MGDLAELFRRLTQGVYVVGAAHGGRRNAFTAAWLMQVSFDPVLVALAVNPENASYPLLTDSGTFAVSVLGRGQYELARRFGTRSGRDEDKLSGVRWRPAAGEAPVLEDAVAFLECRVTAEHAAGDHRIVVAQVVGGALLRPDLEPLSYQDTGDMDGSGSLYPERL